MGKTVLCRCAGMQIVTRCVSISHIKEERASPCQGQRPIWLVQVKTMAMFSLRGRLPRFMLQSPQLGMTFLIV